MWQKCIALSLVKRFDFLSYIVTTTAPTTAENLFPPSSDMSPVTVGLVFGDIPWEALYNSPAHILMLIAQTEKYLVHVSLGCLFMLFLFSPRGIRFTPLHCILQFSM